MILADTSAWVEYDRATESPVDQRLAELIAATGPVAVTEPVVMEVLAGARDDIREAELRRLMLAFELLRFEPVSDFDAAVRIYRRLPRGRRHSARNDRLHDRRGRLAARGLAARP